MTYTATSLADIAEEFRRRAKNQEEYGRLHSLKRWRIAAQEEARVWHAAAEFLESCTLVPAEPSR